MATVPYPGMTVPQKPKTPTTSGAVPQSISVPRPPATATSTGTVPQSSPVPMPPQLNASNYRNADWQDQLKAFQSDSNLARTELDRATKQRNLYAATGDNEALARADRWIGQINTATGGSVKLPSNDPEVERFNQYRKQQDELMSRMQSMINQPVQYNPETDPRYQAYRQLAQARAADASRQTMEALNSRGILNSSVTATQLGEIQQGAEQQALAAIPEFYAQAMQQRQLDLQNAADLLRTVISEDQRYIDNRNYDRSFDRGVFESDRNYNRGVLESDRNFSEAQKAANWNAYLQSVGLTGNTGTGPKSDWSLLGGTDGAMTLEGQQVADNLKTSAMARAAQEAGLTGYYNGNPTMARQDMLFNQGAENRRIGISAQSAANSAGNARFGQLMDIWQATGSAPPGLESMGVRAGTPYFDMVGARQQQSGGNISAKDSADNYSVLIGDLKSEGVTKDQAMRLAQANRNYLSDSDYRKLIDYINNEF